MEGEVIRYKYIFDEEITVESVNRLEIGRAHV